MAIERTLVIAKPDAVGKSVVGKVVDRFETEGLRLLGMKMLRPTRSQVEGFYAEHKGRPFFDPLVAFMTSGPIVPMVWEGEGAIAKVRAINGATNTAEAAPGTLRKTWGTDQRRNLVHSSDSPASAAREISYFFSAIETAPYDPEAWKTAG
jgi:nucleoside-diphosphate kinase